MEFPDELDHPAFLTGVATILGYGIMIAVLTAVVFGIPYLLFSFL
jgi:hypothetical protein